MRFVRESHPHERLDSCERLINPLCASRAAG